MEHWSTVVRISEAVGPSGQAVPTLLPLLCFMLERTSHDAECYRCGSRAKRLLIRLGRFETLLTTACGHIWTDTNQSIPCLSNLPFLKKKRNEVLLKLHDSNSNSALIGLCRGFYHIRVPTFTAMESATR